jgi:hypothetical protein
MVQGRTFGGALVKGFLADATSDDDIGEIVAAEIAIEGFSFSVDPDTIEPVAVPLTYSVSPAVGHCPNCERIVIPSDMIPGYYPRYCVLCGQRLDWSNANAGA